jgi:hypothetical protein
MLKKSTLTALLLMICADLQAAELVGEAVDINTGDPLYTEKHDFSTIEGQRALTTTYLTPDNQIKASRTVRYDGDNVVQYRLTLNNIDYQESVRREGNSLSFEVDNPDEKPKREALEFDANKDPIVDAGFNDYLLRNWEALTAGERVTFYFASTAQMDLVRLQVTLDEKMSNDEMAVFSMTAANPFFRLLVEPVKVGFYRDSRQLGYYRGVSNLKNDAGKAYDVEITFENNQLPVGERVALRD